MDEVLPTYLIHNAYAAVERNLVPYDGNYRGRCHSTKVGQHKSAAHTKARKAKRRMSKKH